MYVCDLLYDLVYAISFCYSTVDSPKRTAPLCPSGTTQRAPSSKGGQKRRNPVPKWLGMSLVAGVKWKNDQKKKITPPL